MKATTSPNVDGWASKLYGSSDAPAVVVSPGADPVALMAWAYGQIKQLNFLLGVISTSSGNDLVIEANELAASIHHQLMQVDCVMLAALERLRPTDNQVPS